MNYNYISSENDSYLSLLCDDEKDNTEIGIAKDIERFKIKALHCGASVLSSVGIDEQGRLYKCLEDIGKSEYSFGSASEWNPKNPILTTSHCGYSGKFHQLS